MHILALRTSNWQLYTRYERYILYSPDTISLIHSFHNLSHCLICASWWLVCIPTVYRITFLNSSQLWFQMFVIVTPHIGEVPRWIAFDRHPPVPWSRCLQYRSVLTYSCLDSPFAIRYSITWCRKSTIVDLEIVSREAVDRLWVTMLDANIIAPRSSM